MFSDGIFAVLITVLVLDLRPPTLPTFHALLLLWPTWLSYGVSYVFIAIVWANHHHLLQFATRATARLMWFNFAHLFSVSLLPLATAWMAVSELAPQPVAFYASVFFLVNLTYILLIRERRGSESAYDHARSIHCNAVPIWNGRLLGVEVSLCGTRYLLLLSDRVFET